MMALGVLLLAEPTGLAYAQQRGSDRALFGGGMGRADQVLSANGNVSAQWFKWNGGFLPGTTAADLPVSTWSRFLQASAQASYRLGLSWMSVDASVGRSANYYAASKRWVGFNIYNLDLNTGPGLSRQVGRRTHLTARAGAGVRPYYWGTTGFGGVLPTTAVDQSGDPTWLLPPDVATLKGVSFQGTGGIGLTQEVSRRVSLYSNYDIDQRWVAGRDDVEDVLMQSISAGARVSVTRHLGIRAGYRFTESRRGSGRVRTQGADLGVDYGRGGTLQLTRRTTLSFNGGASAATDTAGNHRLAVLGNARLSYDIGRTWRASAYYARDLSYSTTFQDTLLTDSVRAELAGAVTSRLTVTAGAFYSTSEIGFSATGRRAAFGNVFWGLQSGLTRHLALGFMHSYSYRRIDQGVILPDGLSADSRGQAVTVYLRAWAPVFSRMRRTSATR